MTGIIGISGTNSGGVKNSVKSSPSAAHISEIGNMKNKMTKKNCRITKRIKTCLIKIKSGFKR
jgi:hypothetical protein